MTRRRIVCGSVAFSTLLFGAYLGACGGDDSVGAIGSDGGNTDGTFNDVQTFDANPPKDSGGTDSGPTDAGPDVAQIVNDAGNFTDAAPGGDAAVLNCGSVSCNIPAQDCCLYDNGGDFTGGCANGVGGCPAPAADGGDAGLVTLGCEVSANCPNLGEVCCITHDTTSGTIKSGCMLAATCATVLVQHRAELCDPSLADAGCNAIDAGACSGTNISTWDLPAGFGTCGGVSAN